MIKLKNISKYYSNNNKASLGLKNINLEFNLGEIVAITGKSGSGKTTLLNVICGLDTYEFGQMIVGDFDTTSFSVEDFEKYRRNNVAFIFQNYQLIDSYTVYQNVLMALIVTNYEGNLKTRCLEIIKEVGLQHRAKHKASKLSGGEKQRCVIARALASNAQILACDEPTGNLDSKTSKEILELIKRVAKDKLVLIVTHNYEQVADIVTRHVRLFDGSIVDDEAIKETIKEEEDIKLTNKHLSLKNFLKIAWYNSFSTPKKLIMMILVFLVMIIAIDGLIYQTNNSGNNYNPPKETYFYQTERRVLITSNNSFNHQELKGIHGVETVLYDDFMYDTPYIIHELLYQNIYAFPSIYKANPKSLVKGRMPNDDSEVVVELGTYSTENASILLDETLPKFGNKKVVGIILNKEGNYNYIYGYKPDSLKYYLFNEMNKNVEITTISNGSHYISPIIDFTIDNSVPKVIFNDPTCFYRKEDILTAIIKIKNKDYNISLNHLEVSYNWNDIRFTMNAAAAEEFFFNHATQASLVLSNQSSIKSVMNQAIGLGYNAYDVSNMQKKEVNFFQNTLDFFIVLSIIAACTVLYFITYLIVSFIMNTKKKDYTVLRTLGLNETQCLKTLFLEINVAVMIGYLVFLILGICFVDEEAIGSIIYDFKSNVFIMQIGIIAIIIIMLSFKFNKKIFKNTINSNLKKEGKND